MPTVVNDLSEVDSSFSTLNGNKFIYLFFSRNAEIGVKKNHTILMPNIKFIKDSQVLIRNSYDFRIKFYSGYKY